MGLIIMSGKDVAVVTGSGRGIGMGVARQLAHDGMRIVIAEKQTDLLASALANLPGVGHIGIELDVSDEQSVERAFEQIDRQVGAIRVLVNNAGIMVANQVRPKLIDFNIEDWDRTFAVNVRGVFLCCRAFLKQQRKFQVEHSRIINMSSVTAQLGGFSADAAYIASKAGILGLTKILAREGAELGVTANVVAPGIIDAPMSYQSGATNNVEAVLQKIPLNRLGTIEDVNHAVSFLASAKSSYMTGSVMDVNGGYRMQ